MPAHPTSQWSIMMKALFASTLAAGIVFAASPTFSQTPAVPAVTPASPATPATPTAPGVRGKANHPEDKVEYHQQWEDCMRNQEAKYGGVKTVGQQSGAHAGEPKGGYKSLSKGKPMPPDEKADAKKGEKENRHQAEMDDCREQLYGRDGPAPGTKQK
jgi:hypothetical protein